MTTNRLTHETSAYLKSAAHQPIDWHPWGDEPFLLAARQNKPVLLDVGAVWCHWCHVMDRESYEDPEVAAIINNHFIAVKVDRDERPEVDRRYQGAVGAITGQGGWPSPPSSPIRARSSTVAPTSPRTTCTAGPATRPSSPA